MKKQLTDLQKYLVDEFVEDYQHGQMSRRDAFKRIAAVSGSTAFAAALLAACGPAPTPPPVPPNAGETNAAPALPTATPVPPTATSAPPTATKPAASPTAAATAARTAEITRIATATVLATVATIAVVTPTPAAATVRVAENDPAIEASTVTFPSDAVSVIGYLARPKGAGPFRAVLVCHENRGLTEHINDVTRRFAKAGYVALAVDLISAQGGTDKVTDAAQIPGYLGNTDPAQFIAWFQAGLAYLQGLAYVQKANIGMTGFCFGGGITWRVATTTPQLKAAVPFYGPNPPLEDVPGIQAAVLAMYGGNDTRITGGAAAIEEAMKKSNKMFDKIVYDGANHAFHNDAGANYKADAAADAWVKMLAWFDKYLK